MTVFGRELWSGMYPNGYNHGLRVVFQLDGNGAGNVQTLGGQGNSGKGHRKRHYRFFAMVHVPSTGWRCDQRRAGSKIDRSLENREEQTVFVASERPTAQLP